MQIVNMSKSGRPSASDSQNIKKFPKNREKNVLPASNVLTNLTTDIHRLKKEAAAGGINFSQQQAAKSFSSGSQPTFKLQVLNKKQILSLQKKFNPKSEAQSSSLPPTDKPTKENFPFPPVNVYKNKNISPVPSTGKQNKQFLLTPSPSKKNLSLLHLPLASVTIKKISQIIVLNRAMILITKSSDD